MARTEPQRATTVEDLYLLPDDGRRYELHAGTLVSEPLPGSRHGRIVAQLTLLLGNHVREHRLGRVFGADTGFILARGPDTARGPDVSFVRRERVEHVGDPVGAFPGPPDLAVEVLSPSTTSALMRAKITDYFAGGTRAVWVVDSTRCRVTVYRTQIDARVLEATDELDGADIVPGFRVRVAAIFEP